MGPWLLWLFSWVTVSAFSVRPFSNCRNGCWRTHAISVSNDGMLENMAALSEEGQQWAQDFGLDKVVGDFYTLFAAMRKINPFGLRGKPFVLRADELASVLGPDKNPFGGFFSLDDLAKAVDDDFLDAGRGSTDRQRGWKMTSVSKPRGNSFEEARMTMEDVERALEKGTVIFNSAGAHIPGLAAPTLAAVDATALPNALNMYVTAPGKRTSAPPHTDKQDVLVVQTSGQKHWRVFSPPDASVQPQADAFARGKGDDDLPVHDLHNRYNSQLLLQTTLREGDVLFVPAAFPHTTDTATTTTTTTEQQTTSIHLTFGFDTRIWDLDYLSVWRLALKKAGVMGWWKESDNPYVGPVNELSIETHRDILEALPMGFLENDNNNDDTLDRVVSESKRIARLVDAETASRIENHVWEETTKRIRAHGMDLLDIHRDMYLDAIEEGRLRVAEDAMTAHLDQRRKKQLTPEQIQRLSLFRVKKYFDKIDGANKALMDWMGVVVGDDGTQVAASSLPDNWAFTMSLEVGDEVEADLGGAFFLAKITRVNKNGTYNVQFFDGDQESGLDRSMIKLMTPKTATLEQEDTSKMTAKELKRWKKKQQKLKK